MIFLEENILISQGDDRLCYQHPEAPDKCIKITYSQNPVQSRKEAAYYQHLISRKVSFRRLSRFYGRIPTNKGKGYVFELIRDYDGNISKTLLHYLGTDSGSVPRIRRDLPRLKNYLVEEGIMVRDLKAENLVYQRLDGPTGKLIIIDGVGNNEFLPVCNWSRYLARKKIIRKWDRFIRKLNSKHPFRSARISSDSNMPA
ncbi:MAG: YrbL family protein [Thermodesulfobacteriota bacterium]